MVALLSQSGTEKLIFGVLAHGLILEKVDIPEDAVAPCRVCIEELHSLSAVQDCFNVQLKKGFLARFGKDERRKIIVDVCHVSFVIYITTLKVCFGHKELSNWPCIISGEDKVDPLRDERVAKDLRKQGMEHCCVTPWSFGQEAEEEQKLKDPRGIATNSNGQLIIGEFDDDVVKMFDPSGQFMQHLSVPNDDVETKLYIYDVATDNKDYIYVLVKYEKKTSSEGFFVYEFSNTADLHHKFAVKGEHWVTLTVINSQVLVLSWFSVAVYNTDGQFFRSFGKGTLKIARDITATNDGRVMVVDRDDSCAHIFSEDGVHLNHLQLHGRYRFPRIVFHRTSEHVVIAGKEFQPGVPSPLHVEILTRDGDFVRSIQIHDERIHFITAMTVTFDGRIAVPLQDIDEKWKVLVI